MAHVFDVDQTSGEPLPERPVPQLLAGQAPLGLWEALAEQVTAHGFTLERGPCGTANGLTHYGARTVTVRDDVDDAQAVKTLAHELAHVLMHDPTTQAAADPSAPPADTSAGHCRGRIEVETESVAYLITHTHGLDSSAYTFPYVAGWAGSVDAVTPETVVRATGQRVLTAARVVLTATEHLGAEPTAVADAAQQLQDMQTVATEGTRRTAALLATAQHTEQMSGEAAGRPDATPAVPPAPSAGKPGTPADPSLEVLHDIHRVAAGFYAARLHSGSPDALRAVALLGRRGVDRDAAYDAGLGYAPRAWTALVDHLRTAGGFSDPELKASGLMLTSARNTLVDRFRDRIMFGVHDELYRPIAFLGRAVDDTATDRAGQPIPKYLNSPDTALYSKGQVLYGLAAATGAFELGAVPVLVEGPMDVLAVNQAGHNRRPVVPAGARFVGVSPCGTALTDTQVTLLDRAAGGLADRGLVVAFDGDPAGRDAARRAFELLRPTGVWPHVVDLPAGLDPSLLLQQHGRAGLLAALQTAAARPLADLVVDARVDRYSEQLHWAEGQLAAGRAAAVVIAALPAEHVGRQVTRLATRLLLPVPTVNQLVLDAVTDPHNDAAVPRAAAHPPDRPPGHKVPRTPGNAAQLAQAGFPVPLSQIPRGTPGPVTRPAPPAANQPGAARRHA